MKETLYKYIVKGLVQGIGYRPWVAQIADELNIKGWVRNTGGVVTIKALGSDENISRFYERLSKEVPAGGYINSIEVIKPEYPESNISNVIDKSSEYSLDTNITHLTESYYDFKIIMSDADEQENLPLIPADIATCENCKKELFDPDNRRFRHPFISCTSCGPRYSIIERLPYDRETITMNDFKMCRSCQEEYTKKSDRRRHAQTIACKSCGPMLDFITIRGKISDNVTLCGYVDNFVDSDNANVFEDEITQAAAVINEGGIVAIKDIGGYHLACSPFNKAAVSALRLLKHREAKPFAVMFENVDKIREYCFVDNLEEELLESNARPIVLVKRKCEQDDSKAMADNVLLTSSDMGAMLPCNPLQMLLIHECGPLIMTSGNASGDVLEIDDDKMKSWLEKRTAAEDFPKDIPVVQLRHNRRILRPMDDSVIKVVKGRRQFVRRGRGHVPTPIPVDIQGEIFAAGGDLKSSFCYVKNGLAYVSQYLGDLEAVSCQKFYKNEMESMKNLFGFAPKAIVADTHPAYFSRQFAEEMARNTSLPITYVQHHKAHVAAVMAEHRLKGPVLGFAFDGTGYGDDGNVWGSEVFLWDGTSNPKEMKRVSHLSTVKLIGGDEGAKNCDTILTGFLHSNDLDELDNNPDAGIIRTAIDKDINTTLSTSMGRLFDAVAAMLGICHYNTYEGQAPIELENLAAKSETSYKLNIGRDGDTAQLFRDIKEAISNDVAPAKIARGFIYAVADYIKEIAICQNIKQIALSGGTFLNRILLEKVISDLEAKGFTVYISEQLPPGDGSICLGQVAMASSSFKSK